MCSYRMSCPVRTSHNHWAARAPLSCCALMPRHSLRISAPVLLHIILIQYGGVLGRSCCHRGATGIIGNGGTPALTHAVCFGDSPALNCVLACPAAGSWASWARILGFTAVLCCPSAVACAYGTVDKAHLVLLQRLCIQEVPLTSRPFARAYAATASKRH
jgi:hypothetical protein